MYRFFFFAGDCSHVCGEHVLFFYIYPIVIFFLGLYNPIYLDIPTLMKEQRKNKKKAMK